MVNSAKFKNLPAGQYFSFCVGRNTNYFMLRFCAAIEYVIGNIQNFMMEFLKLQNVNFQKKKYKTGLHGTQELKQSFGDEGLTRQMS
jgi:hypothetical protein